MARVRTNRRDVAVKQLLDIGRITVDVNLGLAWSSTSNTPDKPLGAMTAKGYLITTFNYRGATTSAMIHRIIWISQHGVPDDTRLQINHINGIKTDNRLANLELVTHADNAAHAKSHGLLRHIRGEAHYAARLTVTDVANIKKLYANGVNGSDIARSFGVSRTHIGRIVTGHAWRQG